MPDENLREQFFTAVGRCLHAWGFIELEVANLYMILHGIGRDAYAHPSRAAFEAVISLEVRLAMIMAYVEADPALDSYREHIKPLCAFIIKKYKKRHEMAHFLIAAERTKDSWVYGLRPFVTMYGFSRGALKALSLEQIEERKQSFNQLGDRIRQHVQHVGALKQLPTEYYARPGEIAFPALEPLSQTPTKP